LYPYLFPNKRHQGVNKGAFSFLYVEPLLFTCFWWGFFTEFLCKFIFRKTHSHNMLLLPFFSLKRGYQSWIFLCFFFCKLQPTVNICQMIIAFTFTVILFYTVGNSRWPLKCNICLKIGVCSNYMDVIIIWTSAEIFDFPIKSPLRNVL